jgi:stringent starvation protein B
VKAARPYLLRALYEWILDSDCTPYLIVSTDVPGVRVPEGYAKDDRIVLNISPRSVRDLLIGEREVTFDGRFAGRAFAVVAPVGAVVGIYAKETGEGMAFDAERESPASESPATEPTGPETPRPRGGLKVVK